ncbi:MAG TPA: hypothetical protein VER55_15330 [Ardenticatenaceae bacterium]|nr:hypothetical protein [Ardenticatenaceae bacterium]
MNTAMWVIIKTSLARLAASDVAAEGQAGLVLTLFGLMLVAQMHVT